MRTLVVLLIAVVVGCTQDRAPREAFISVDVTDDQGHFMPNISILVDETPAATTDKKGHARAIVQAETSGRVRVQAKCPDDYRSAEARSVVLSRQGGRGTPLTLRMTCAPLRRTLAVVVRAPGAEGLTLRADGAPVAHVAADGTAHVVLQREPDSTLRLSLDTSDAPKLSPQFPVRELHVADRDEIVIFDQPLVAQVKPVRRVTRKPPAPAPEIRHVPYSIGR